MLMFLIFSAIIYMYIKQRETTLIYNINLYLCLKRKKSKTQTVLLKHKTLMSQNSFILLHGDK